MGFRECSLYTECRTTTPTAGRLTPTPIAHAHTDKYCFIGLYKKSDTLWNLPSLRPSRTENKSKPDVISADHSSLPGPRPGRGRGAFLQGLHPVYIPGAHRLTEAFILLILRDFGQLREFFWRAMITYVIEFVWDDGLLDLRDLEPHHRRFIQRCANPGDMGMRKILDDLKDESTPSN